MQNLIKEYVDGIKIGKVQSYKNLAVFPLVSDYQLDLDYLTPDEALDKNAIDTPKSKKGSSADNEKASEFVRNPTTCKVEPHPSVGLGTDCRLESKKITGFALTHDNKIYHLSAFSRQGMDRKEKSFTRMIRLSQRRRFRI